MQKEIEELDEKIERIEFDLSMIKKNNKNNIKGDKRFYYSCCLCCETKEILEQIKNTKKEKEKKMNELIEPSRENTSEYFCGAAFITFNTIKEQEEYLHQRKGNCCSRLMDAFITIFKIYYYCLCPYCFCCLCCCCCFCCYCSCCSCGIEEKSFNSYKRKIKFERAPEPEDIIYENLGISFKTKLKNLICVSFISLIICSISIFINTLLSRAQMSVDKSKEKNDKTIIVYILSLIITIITAIFDFILEIILEKIVKCEKSNTITNFYSTYSINLTFFWFINSNNFAISEEYEVLTSNMPIKFLFNSFVTPIMWVINAKLVYKKFKQCIIEQKEKIDYNQKELNELYELQSMNIAAKYSYLVKTLLISFLYAPIFPLGFFISFIGLIFGYWLEKFNFSKNYKKPEKLDKQIAEYYIIYFFIIFYVYIVGNFVFLLAVIDVWIIISICLFFILLFIPFNRFFYIDFFKFKESEVHKKTYDEMYLDFTIDYERANPMTRVEGEMRYLDKLEEKNKIDKKEKDKRQKKLKEENQMKFYLNQRRTGKIINRKELNNVLNIDNGEQKKVKDKDIFCNIEPTIENYKKGKQIFKTKTFNKRKKSSKINFKK